VLAGAAGGLGVTSVVGNWSEVAQPALCRGRKQGQQHIENDEDERAIICADLGRFGFRRLS
jgi:hypothetical protein